MAKDAIDEVARTLPFKVAPSCTESIRLLGADGYESAWNGRHRIAGRHGIHVARVEHLLTRYGSLATELLDAIDERPELGAALPGADDYLAAEVVYAVRAEGAMHLDDVLTRRTRASIETFDRGTGAAEVVADLMADDLGWSVEQRENEVSHYLARVAAERASQDALDDETADAARLGAPDIRPVA